MILLLCIFFSVYMFIKLTNMMKKIILTLWPICWVLKCDLVFFLQVFIKQKIDLMLSVVWFPFVKIDLDNLIKVFRKFLKSQLWQNFVRINEKNARYIIIDALSHIVFVFYLINTFLKLLHKQCLLSSNNLLILFPYYKMLCFDLISS